MEPPLPVGPHDELERVAGDLLLCNQKKTLATWKGSDGPLKMISKCGSASWYVRSGLSDLHCKMYELIRSQTEVHAAPPDGADEREERVVGVHDDVEQARSARLSSGASA